MPGSSLPQSVALSGLTESLDHRSDQQRPTGSITSCMALTQAMSPKGSLQKASSTRPVREQGC